MAARGDQLAEGVRLRKSHQTRRTKTKTHVAGSIGRKSPSECEREAHRGAELPTDPTPDRDTERHPP